MQAISNTYKNYLENTLSLSPKSKIIVGEKEYLGNVIMSTPKVSHSNSSIIGGFPSKTCSFSLYNPNNDIDLENKEIEVYKGLVIDDVIEWVKQGVFIPRSSNITNDITTRTYKISNAQDRTQLLDGIYESNLDWATSHTGLEIVQEICARKGITLETTGFNFASYVFETQPNFSSAITDREVISRVAQIGGEIAIFNNDGNVVIKSSTPTGHTITRKKYEKLSHEKPFVVNTVVLGKEGIDDIVMVQDADLMNAGIGKNKIDISKYEPANYHKGNFELDDDVLKITITELYTSVNNFVVQWKLKLKPNTTYTLYGKTERSNNAQNSAWYLYSDRLWGSGTLGNINTSTPKTFTTDNTGNLVVGLYLRDSVEIGDIVTISNLQIEEGNAATSYRVFEPTGAKEIRINDNPFTDLIREEIIDTVASFIIGKSIIPFNAQNVVDGFYLELNDSITIIDKDNNSIEATILNYETSNKIKSNLKAETEMSISNYNLGGSTKKVLNEVKLQVDHINNEIRSIVSKGYVNEEDLEVLRQSLVTQNEESITMTFTTLTEIMNSANAETQKQFQEQSKYIRFDGGVSLGEVGNEVTLRIENDTIYFSVSDVKIMEITPNGIKIEKVITEEIDMGDFALIVEEDGSLSLV